MTTIFALSSGAAPAGIGVIRVSGPDAMMAVAALAGPLPPPREARVRALRDAGGALLDGVRQGHAQLGHAVALEQHMTGEFAPAFEH